MLAALIGQKVAKYILRAQPLQDGSGSVEFITDHRRTSLSNDSNIMKALVIVADGGAWLKLFCPGVKAGQQALIFIYGYVFEQIES